MGSFRDDMAAGYRFEVPTVRLGRPFAAPEQIETSVEVGIPLAFLNRHGLIAGATGTGKTRTLQLIAEQVSAAGCPVFAADMKGDLAGVGAPGTPDEKLTARAAELAEQWAPAACPVELLSLTGEGGVPLRATVTGFGSTLLAKVLSLNETQESSLALVFRFCDEKGLALIDLEDLRAALAYLTGPGKAELKELGGISASTAGVLLREVSQLEGEGGDVFFGEPALEVADLLRVAPDGRGIVSVLGLADVARRPALFSTFLMWVLAELFETLPEVGDTDKPKLVFFFDEAHLLFDGASKAFLESVTQTVRLIRSKGVGVFFITQLPTDIPDEVLSPARPPRAARGAGVHPEGRPRAEGRRRDLPDHRALPRPGGDAVVAGGGGGGGDGARPARRADPGGRHPALPARLADDAAHPGGARRDHRGLAPAAALCRAHRPRERGRAAGGAGPPATRPRPRRCGSARSPRPSARRPRATRAWRGRWGTLLSSTHGQQVTREVVRGIFGMLKRR